MALYPADWFPLAEAADKFPRKRGRKVSRSTLYRWSRSGLRGVRLETRRVGGALYTVSDAIQRFLSRQNELNDQKRGSK